MSGLPTGIIIGVSAGVFIGFLLAIGALYFFKYHKRRSRFWSRKARTISTLPIQSNGCDASITLSDSTSLGPDSPKYSDTNRDLRKDMISMSGVPKYSYRDLQKATNNFSTDIGQGAFGTVYKAQMSTGETVAVKVLKTNSKEGEKEFETEVLLLGRLHHRNLVNLVGYCTEKGRNMLIYVYMPNGSLASHLYDVNCKPLSWDMRIYIALDIARGLEYLHDGANPPVVHRDIKSSNILLDQSMGARVADFGLSREDNFNHHPSNIKGTFGYLDPEYVSTKTYTKKSDIYSFGLLLFELITGRSPQQGLIEYVELGAINADGSPGWEDIIDPRMDGKYDVKELHEFASIAHKCIKKVPQKRPSMRDIVQVFCDIIKVRNKKTHHSSNSSLSTPNEEEIKVLDAQSTSDDHRRVESTGSLSDFGEV